MRPKIKELTMENFKSYKDVTTISEIMPLTTIMGPNGSGKSNLADAIAFVMGERVEKLRVSSLRQLRHGDRKSSKSCSVTVVLELEDGEEITFMRYVHGNVCRYQINEEIFTEDDYLVALKRLGINMKAQNFVVYQGDMDFIALQSPEQRTEMFEMLSKSGELKDDYDRLSTQVDTCSKALRDINKSIIECAANYRSGQDILKNQKEYETMLAALKKKTAQKVLFQLFCNEKKLQEARISMELCKQNQSLAEQELKRLGALLKEARKKKMKEPARALEKEEADLRQARNELRTKDCALSKAQAKRSPVLQKLKQARTTLKKYKQMESDTAIEIQRLQTQLEVLRQARVDHEARQSPEVESPRIDLEFADARLEQYHRLRAEVGKQTAANQKILLAHERDLKTQESDLEMRSRQIGHTKMLIEWKQRDRTDLLPRIEQLNNDLQDKEAQLTEKQASLKSLQNVSEHSPDIVELEQEWEKAQKMLDELQPDRNEIGRLQTLSKLQKYSEKVIDRVANLVKPVHKKYSTVLTKVLKRQMDPIVVEDAATAKRWMHYLEVRGMQDETFLPLDTIVVKAIPARLMAIKETANVQLLFELLKCDERFENVAECLAKNVLVCETAEDARTLAWEMKSGKNDAISLNGTMFGKHGTMSFGVDHSTKKSKRSNEEEIGKWAKTRDDCMANMDAAEDNCMHEFQVQSLNADIQHLNASIESIKRTLRNMENQVESIDAEVQSLQETLTQLNQEQEVIQTSIDSLRQNIRQVRRQIEPIEDRVFGDFNANAGLANIRQYDPTNMARRFEQRDELHKYDVQMERITTLLESKRSQNFQANIKKWEDAIAAHRNQIQTMSEQVEVKNAAVEKMKKVVKEREDMVRVRRQQLQTLENRLEENKKEQQKVKTEAATMRANALNAEALYGQLKEERHFILLESKLKGVELPLLEGSMDDIYAPDPEDESSGSDSPSEIQYGKEHRLEIDYSSLPQRMTDLDTSSDVGSVDEDLEEEIAELTERLTKEKPVERKSPNLDVIRSAWKQLERDQKKCRAEHTKAKEAFGRVKAERLRRFNEFYKKVEGKLDEIFRSLTGGSAASASLIPDNLDEPYLGGIMYQCMVGGKKFQTSLSGGENTIAAMALLFAINDGNDSPFMLFDEIDAALDNKNVLNAIRFLQRAQHTQVIFVSHKNLFCVHCNMLIGVTAKANVATLESDVSWVCLDEYVY